MGVAARSHEAIEDRIAGLQETYGSMTVNQTTVSLPGERFESVADRYAGGLVDAYVAVENGHDGVLHVADDDGLELPGTAPGANEPLERGARRAVEDATGVRCRIDGLREVTITGIRNADSGKTVYRLVVVFSAEYLDGPVGDQAEWADRAAEVAPLHV